MEKSVGKVCRKWIIFIFPFSLSRFGVRTTRRSVGRSRLAGGSLALRVQLTLHPRFGTHPSSDSRSQSQSPFAPFPGCISLIHIHHIRTFHTRSSFTDDALLINFWPFVRPRVGGVWQGRWQWQASFAASTWCCLRL